MRKLLIALVVLFHAAISTAQTFPSKPLRIIVPFPAGGGEPLPAGRPEEVDAMVARALERWTKLVRATGLKID